MIPAPWRFTIAPSNPERIYPPFNLSMPNLPNSPADLDKACDALRSEAQIDILPSDLVRGIFGRHSTFFAFCVVCDGDPTRN